MQKTPVIAIACADLHLSHTPPVFRSNDNWYDSMKYHLKQIKDLKDKYKCPIFCAGDIFHTAKSDNELINFAIMNLPNMHTIPGQHDLPLHNYDDMHKSAYGTMCYSAVLKDIGTCCIELSKTKNNKKLYTMFIHGFPWGKPLRKNIRKSLKGIHIALVHDYAWIKGHSYITAPSSKSIASIKDIITTYDIVIFGDNHQGFICKYDNTYVINCGSMMKRHKDQIDYKPFVGLILQDGTIKKHYLDTSKDIYLSKKGNENESDIDISSFVSELNSLSENPEYYDFKKVVLEYFKKSETKSEVKKIILNTLDKV